MPTEPTSPLRRLLTEPGGLAEQLMELRKSTGLKLQEFAELAGIQPNRASKISNGIAMPTGDELDQWAEAAGQPERAEALRSLAEDVQVVHRSHDGRLRTVGQAGIQAERKALDQSSLHIRTFQTLNYPGLLQTVDFARAVMTKVVARMNRPESDIEEAVTGRLARQQVLYDQSKRFEFLLWEPILSFPPHGFDVALGQLDRIGMLAQMANIRIGVLPADRPLASAPLHSFSLYDDVAQVELLSGSTWHEGDQAKAYHEELDRLWGDAVEGQALRPVLARAAEQLRELKIEAASRKETS